MFKRQPAVVAYKSIDDLVTLKEWFYNFDDEKDNRKRAVDRVKALTSRGRLPHGIETTSLITSIILNDEQTKATDSNIIQLSYSMVLTRFVNGVLDPLQQSNYAIPLHQLAKSVNIPSFFVELRHMATHERLPLLNILRRISREALNWLYDNYWNKISDMESDIEDSAPVGLSIKDETFIHDSVKTQTEVVYKITGNLKIYKRIRKQDLNYIYKYGNSSETGLKYWKAIKLIKSAINSNHRLLFHVLMFKGFMIYSGDKLETKGYNPTKYAATLVKLYKPLLDDFGIGFKLNLVWTILNHLSGDSDNNHESIIEREINNLMGFNFKGDEMKLQAVHVAGQVLTDINISKTDSIVIDSYSIKSADDMVNVLMTMISKLDNPYQLDIMKYITTLKLSQSLHNTVSENIAEITKHLKLKQYEQVESLDSLLGNPEPEQKPKKPKLTSTHYFLEPHENWEPVPFGSVV